jgi:hypothetical protein
MGVFEMAQDMAAADGDGWYSCIPTPSQAQESKEAKPVKYQQNVRRV